MRWTKSKDGHMRATMRIEIRINQKMFQWLQAQLGGSERTTALLLRDQLDSIIGCATDFQSLHVSPGGTLGYHSSDDDDSYKQQGYKVCPYVIS